MLATQVFDSKSVRGFSEGLPTLKCLTLRLTSLFILIFAFNACKTGPKRIENLHRLSLENEAYLNELKERMNLVPLSLPKETLGYVLYDPVEKKILESQNSTTPFIPSSTTKVLTAIAALRILGPEYKFKTTLAYTGRIRGTTLEGDVYLKGEGDPSLSIPHLMNLARALTDLRITKITGKFYYDESALVPVAMIRDSGDISASFNPGLGALSVDFNQVFLQWHPSLASSSDIEASTIPDLSSLDINLVEDDGESPARFSYTASENRDHWGMSRRFEFSGEKKLPVRRPSLWTSLIFSKFCRMNGIALPYPEQGRLPKGATILVRHQSAPLVEVAERALEFSNNMMSELILLATARKLAGHPVSVSDAAQLLKKWWKTESRTSASASYSLGHSLWNSLELENGSGLASRNRITPLQFITALEYSDRYRYSNRNFESLLPVSGWKGTLAKRLELPEAAFHIWAKTGTMSYSSALTGYVHTLRGKRLVFAILLSDLKQREVMDNYGDLVPLEEEKKASQWTRNAQKIQDGILENWIVKY